MRLGHGLGQAAKAAASAQFSSEAAGPSRKMPMHAPDAARLSPGRAPQCRPCRDRSGSAPSRRGRGSSRRIFHSDDFASARTCRCTAPRRRPPPDPSSCRDCRPAAPGRRPEGARARRRPAAPTETRSASRRPSPPRRCASWIRASVTDLAGSVRPASRRPPAAPLTSEAHRDTVASSTIDQT